MGWLLKVFAADGVVYAAGLGLDDKNPEIETIQLVRVPLDGAPVSLVGRAPFHGAVMPQIHRSAESAWKRGADRVSSIQLQAANLRRAACLASGNVFIATHLGVFIFPTNGGVPELLCGTNGLPSDDVHSLAFLNGKLYVGAGELNRVGYLAEYDPATKAVRTVASSRRKEAGSPFDDQVPFFPAFLWADEVRGRVLMLAGTHTSNSLSGWWAFTPATGRFQQLVHLRTHLLTTYSLWGGEAEPGILGAFSHEGISLWDAQSDQFAFQYKRTNEEPSPFWPSRRQGSVIVLHPPLLRRDGWFWWANPLQRVSLDGQKIELLPPVPGRDETHRIECLQFLDGGRRMLAADRSGVWLLELPSEKASSAKDSRPNHTSNEK